MNDPLVTTRVSKQAFFDKEKMLEDIDGLGSYFVICLTPSSRWLLTTLLEFYGEFHNRFQNFSGEREIDQLRAETLLGLICPMACSEDILTLITAVQGIGLTMIEIRDRLGPTDGDLDAKLVDLSTDVQALTTAVESAVPSSLFDDLEPILDGVGVILGATGVLP